jgi:glycosyltransferase involved in cell wall biosynthesis
MTHSITLNGRFLSQPITGVQRYARELTAALDKVLGEEDKDPERRSWTMLSPRRTADFDLDLKHVSLERVGRLDGNLWVQLELPFWARDTTLWSMTNTGPLLHRRHIVTIHDVAFLEHPEWFSPRFAAWYGFLLPRLARRAARILTVSEFSRRRLVETVGADPERISVIHNGVNPRFTPAARDVVESVVDRLGVPRKYVLALGSLEPRKNLVGLLKAWKLVLSRRNVDKDTFLVVTGGQGKAFRKLALRSLPERVAFTGYIDDKFLPALYSGASAFVYPSLYEGFGLPPLEAMACGVPVVTSTSTAIPEVTGDAALLVDPGDEESIAYGLQAALEDTALREKLRVAGFERVKLYKWEYSARKALKQAIETAERPSR